MEFGDDKFQEMSKTAHEVFNATISAIIKEYPDMPLSAVLVGMAGSFAEFGLFAAPDEMNANEALERIMATVQLSGLQVIAQTLGDE